MYSGIYAVCEFKFATWILQDTDGVAMATK